MNRWLWFIASLALANPCVAVASSEPEVQVVTGGELAPIAAPSAPRKLLGDSDEKGGRPKPPLPPAMPPNHGHVVPDPDEGEGSPTPAPTPPEGVRENIFDPGIILGHDPQLAVGPKFIIAIEAHTIAFFDKKGALLPPKTPKGTGPSPNPMPQATPFPVKQSASDFFGVFLQPHINGSKKPNPLDVNWNIPNAAIKDKKLGCDPENPDKLGGCIVEAYDTRVLYDSQRDRFWIESNLRNEVQIDDGNCDPKDDACVPEGSPFKLRFEAVAVSKTNDPRDGFFSFVFHDNQPGDFPRIGVHHSFFTLGSNGSTKVHLFDADAIVHGKKKDILRATLRDADLGHPSFVYPVVEHDKRNGANPNAKPFFPGVGDTTDVPTLLLTTNGSRVTIFGFEDPPHGAPPAKPHLMSGSIDLGHDAPHLLSPPVYRDGKIYLVGGHCIASDDQECVQSENVIVIPVFRLGDTILPSKEKSRGFRDFFIGGHKGPGGSYEIAALDVNKNNDIAVVYGRGGLPIAGRRKFEPGAYYSLLLHDDPTRHDGWLREGRCEDSPGKACGLANPSNSEIDVAGIGVDPSDDTTFWMTHGFAESDPGTKHNPPGVYAMVMAEIIPRAGYVPANPTRSPDLKQGERRAIRTIMKTDSFGCSLRSLVWLPLLLGATLSLAHPCLAGPFVFQPTGSMIQGRAGHTATLLRDGRVLVAGGYNEIEIASSELYDPASATWTNTGRLAIGRQNHTATLLPNGMVLVAGGTDRSGLTTASAELYNPATGAWTPTGSLLHDRALHTATLLAGGRVLVAGGSGSSGFVASAELYDPATGVWTATGRLANPALRSHGDIVT